MHQILVIDQQPLFEDALDECQRACRTLTELQAEVTRFETQELPAFERWLRRSFTDYVEEKEELATLIREKEEFLFVLKQDHWKNFFGGGPAIRHAYSGPGFGPGEFGYVDPEGNWQSFEAEDVYGEEISPKGRGAFDDDGLPDDDLNEDGTRREDYRYQTENGLYDDEEGFAFEDSDDEFYVRNFERREGGYRSRARTEDRSGPGSSRQWRFAGDGPKTHSSSSGGFRNAPHGQGGSQDREDLLTRIKERYRLLVRKLHPDLNPDLPPESKTLWNQVQVAYRDGNLDQLDLLIALSEAYTGSVSPLTSLHQLRRAAQEIRKSLTPFRKRLEVAKESRAWGFLALTDRSELERSIGREYERDIEKLNQQLSQVEAQMKRFQRKSPSPLESENRI